MLRALLLSCCAAVVSAASVTTFDGRTATGATVVFTGTGVSLDGRAIPLGDVDQMVLPGTAPVGLRATLGVHLVDGGWLPAAGVTAGTGDRVVVRLATGGTVELPLAALRGWGVGDLPGAADERDHLLINGQEVAGRLDGLAGGALRFTAEGLGPLEPPPALADITGLRLGGPVRTYTGTVLSVSLNPTQPPVQVLAKPGLPLACAPTATMAHLLPGARLRGDGPRRVWLSSLTPGTVKEEGAFGVVWPFATDRDLDGGPLRLGGVHFDRGLTLHSKARLEWRLGGAYLRLEAMVGISDVVVPEGDCTVVVTLDGKEAWRRDRVRGTEPSQALVLDLTGIDRLEVLVDLGERYDIADHLVLAGACLIKK